MKRLLLFALIVLATACGTADSTPVPAATPTPSPTPVPTAASVTLQFWTVLPDKGINDQNLGELIQLFHREYPLIDITVSSQPTYTDLYRKVVASIAAGTLPDLVTGLDADMLQYARLKALTPLDDLVSAGDGLSTADLRDIPFGMLETMKLSDQPGKLYSLPFARGALALYYNWSAMKGIFSTGTISRPWLRSNPATSPLSTAATCWVPCGPWSKGLTNCCTPRSWMAGPLPAWRTPEKY